MYLLRKQPIRLLLCGVPKAVDSIVNLLHVLGFAFIWGMEPASTIAFFG
ncbi:hypothetical protein QUA82_13845 [Microcoleus sp. F8-D3]